MNEEALQIFVDSRIPKELQDQFSDRVNAYRAGWAAAERFRDQETNKTADSVYSRRPRTVDSTGA
jgi:hypothetical protein